MNDPASAELQKKISALPREIPPARNLWPAIEAQLDLPARKQPDAKRRPLFWLTLAAAAALVVAAGLHRLRPVAPADGWNVASLAGAPRVGRMTIAGHSRLAVGQWLETDATSRASLAVGTIGEVQLEPNSRLRLVNTSVSDHRLELTRGTLSALIWAPPRLFFVETPGATAIDLGCAYTLTVDDAGGGLLRVTSGYVALQHGDHEALIPAGLVCLTRPGAGPGTPFAENTAPALRIALERFDFAGGGAAALDDILARSAPGDEVTLWHLLARAGAPQRAAIFDRLAAMIPPPAGVTRDGILAGDRVLLERWARDLGLGPALAAR